MKIWYIYQVQSYKAFVFKLPNNKLPTLFLTKPLFLALMKMIHSISYVDHFFKGCLQQILLGPF